MPRTRWLVERWKNPPDELSNRAFIAQLGIPYRLYRMGRVGQKVLLALPHSNASSMDSELSFQRWRSIVALREDGPKLAVASGNLKAILWDYPLARTALRTKIFGLLSRPFPQEDQEQARRILLSRLQEIEAEFNNPP